MRQGTLLIRADASLAIGTGHVMRCLALAEAWQDNGGTVSLATAELPDPLRPRLTAEGLTLSCIRAVPGGPEDAAATIGQAQELNATWVAVDGDRFGRKFLQSIRAAGFRVLLVDDFADRESFPADLIVNPNMGENSEPYQKRGTTAQLLIGAPYILLRREFRQAATHKKISETGNRILVTLGGSDPENLAPKIADALSLDSDLKVTLVAGAAYDKENELQRVSTRNLQVVFNPSDMAHLMSENDLGIIAAGGTLWELLAMSCAVLSYSRNAVQARVVEALSRRGAVVDLGETRQFDPRRLAFSVNELVHSRTARERMANLSRSLVDGLGASRVAAAARQIGAR